MDVVSGKMEESTLIIELSGRIDSSNADKVEKDVFALIDENHPENIVFEAKNLEYISSSGLRILLKVIQGSNNKVVMKDVNESVNEILHVTGFSTLMKTEKAMREISIDGCELIGKGGNGSVYRIDEDTIVKVYTKNTPLQDIEKERTLARTAFLLGIPTAISYDIVKVNDVYGIVFEMIKAETMSSLMSKDPEKYGKEFGELLKKFHSTKADKEKIPSTKAIYKGFVEGIKERITPEEATNLSNFIDGIPDRDTLIHGDYHPGNVMYQGDEPILIDMGDIGYGHPIFDLSGVYASLVLGAKMNPEHLKQFFGIDVDTALKAFDSFEKAYFNTDDVAKLEQINQLLGAYSMLKALMGLVQGKNLPEEAKVQLVENLRQHLFPIMDKLSGALVALGI